jgi:hypothetical protein
MLMVLLNDKILFSITSCLECHVGRGAYLFDRVLSSISFYILEKRNTLLNQCFEDWNIQSRLNIEGSFVSGSIFDINLYIGISVVCLSA